MTFTYPCCFRPIGTIKGYHVEFRTSKCCRRRTDPDLEDAVENAEEAAYNWLYLEVEEGTYEFPNQTHPTDIKLEEEPS